MATLNAIHTKMHKAVNQAGGRIEAVFYCPDTDESNSPCRKPDPGMFHAIAERFNVSLEHVPAVGDSLRDLQAAAAVGRAADPGAHRQGDEDPRGRQSSRGNRRSIPTSPRGAGAVAMIFLRSLVFRSRWSSSRRPTRSSRSPRFPLPRSARYRVISGWARIMIWLAAWLLAHRLPRRWRWRTCRTSRR